MKQSTLDLRILFYKTFGTSILLHLIAVLLFSFTFQVKSKRPDPFFNFLGSILRDRDFVQNYDQGALGREKTISYNLPSSIELDRHKAKYNHSFQVKPGYDPRQETSSKVHPKSLFEAPIRSKTVSDEELKEILKIETQAPARIPLKL